MLKIDELKKSLNSELNEETVNFNKILSLANQIAKFDEENVRFSVDASHISRLGIELVSKQETAVAELIKNAFDADATSVDLFFRNTDEAGGSLEVRDNGHGMSRSQLLDGFMRLSTQEKVINPLSSGLKRQRAGRKGIGRFAAQRLGKELQIKTQLEMEQSGLQLDIDWNQFEGGKDLFQITNQVKICEAQARGTTLLIGDLRDAWSEAQIQRTYRYISSLLQPFPLNERTTLADKTENIDSGFKVTIFKENEIIASEDESIFHYALAKIIGIVDENGVPFVKIVSEKYKIDIYKEMRDFDLRIKQKPDLDAGKYKELAGIQYSAYYFISDELPPGTRSMVRDILNRYGGIRVYRNGFRVLPYGESFDDWLGLQRSSALREILPPHHNTNFLGFVEIQDVKGAKFEETASREGLLENLAFQQLQDFVYRSLMAGVLEIALQRKRKRYASDPAVKKEEQAEKSPKIKAQEIANQVRELVHSTALQNKKTEKIEDNSGTPNLESNIGDKTVDRQDAIAYANALADKIEELGTDSHFLLEENGMLRVLASLGLTIGEFTHEIRHALAGLSATISLLNKRVESDDSLDPICASLKNNIELLQSYVRYFDNAVMQNTHRKLDAHEIRDLIGDFAEMIKPTLIRQGVELTVEIKGYDLYTKPMHHSEWASIFLNLFTNSLKAIHRKSIKGRIMITAEANDDRLYIKFSDNGDGIPQENRNRIFDAFFTTSPPSGVMSSDSEKLVGTGLGLKIVRDILNGANGDIEVVSPPPDYSTSFCIEVPLALKEEIKSE